jgi:hypothetical protein
MVHGPDGYSLRGQAVDHMGISSGMLAQAVGKHQPGTFGFCRTVPVKNRNTVIGCKIAGGFRWIHRGFLLFLV